MLLGLLHAKLTPYVSNAVRIGPYWPLARPERALSTRPASVSWAGRRRLLRPLRTAPDPMRRQTQRGVICRAVTQCLCEIRRATLRLCVSVNSVRACSHCSHRTAPSSCSLVSHVLALSNVTRSETGSGDRPVPVTVASRDLTIPRHGAATASSPRTAEPASGVTRRGVPRTAILDAGRRSPRRERRDVDREVSCRCR